MIVDCHTHINLDENFDLDRFEQASAKVSNAFVLASACDNNNAANKIVAKYASENSKIIPFGVFNPIVDDLDNLRDFRQNNLCGVVIYCSDFNMHPAHSRAMEAYKIALDLQIPVFFHNTATAPESTLDYAQPYLIDEIARKFPELKMVVAEMGYPFREQTLALIKKNPNVYACLRVSSNFTFRLYHDVTAAYEASVLDKLFFGSGYPQGQINESVESLLGFNRTFADTQLCSVPRAQLRDIVERDALEILGITQGNL